MKRTPLLVGFLIVNLAFIAGIAIFIRDEPGISRPLSISLREPLWVSGQDSDSAIRGKNADNATLRSSRLRGTTGEVSQARGIAIPERDRPLVPAMPAAESIAAAFAREDQPVGSTNEDETRVESVRQSSMPSPRARNSGVFLRLTRPKVQIPLRVGDTRAGVAFEEQRKPSVENTAIQTIAMETVSAVREHSAAQPIANALTASNTVAPIAVAEGTERPSWPRGSFTPEEQLYRAQYGWAAFSDALRGKALDSPEP